MVSRIPRYEVNIEVDCSTRDMFLANRVTNISTGGLFMETHNPLPLQSEVLLTLRLPEINATIQTKGRVIWTYDIRKGTTRLLPGTGIKFTKMSLEHQRLLEKYIAGLEGEPDRRH